MRRDIQLLRGIAVLLVVIFHAGVGIFNRGYLGVDVFFVISGFLITKIILQGLNAGDFSFVRFYLRRAKRLLPALYSTLLVTGLLAHQMLTPEQLVDFIEQFIGAVTFSSNLVLPTQIGYFADEAATKPLLHIWSLSLEEQYYFTMPLFLFILSTRWRLPGLISAFLASFVWCLAWVTASGSPPFLWRFGGPPMNEWAFFLFPTRAWELLVGSICAWIVLKWRDFSIAPAIKWTALSAIFYTSIWGFDPVHPRGDAFIVVIATALLMLGNDKWLPRTKVSLGIEKVGDWSYSVYLVHWPIFVFMYLGYVEQVPTHINAMLIGVVVAVGYLQFRYIETPFRYHWDHPNGFIWRRITVASLILLFVPLGVLARASWSLDRTDPIKEVRRSNIGLSEECEGSFDGKKVKDACAHGDAPTLAVWGDSYAMHLIKGISVSNKNLVQLTKSSCGPFVDLAPMHRKKYNEAWARDCMEHNDKALKFIKDSASITHVILSSSFDQYFDNHEGRFYVRGITVEKNADIARAHLVRTIQELRAAGKEPILVSPPPRSGFNIGLCLEREDRGLLLFRNSCDVALAEYTRLDSAVNDALASVVREAGVKIIWIKDLLCEAGRCATRLNGTYVYRDRGHLSVDGSVALFGEMRFGTH